MAARGPVVVIDNYDSFTYNLCQVRGCWSQQQAAQLQIGTLPEQHFPVHQPTSPVCSAAVSGQSGLQSHCPQE